MIYPEGGGPEGGLKLEVTSLVSEETMNKGIEKRALTQNEMISVEVVLKERHSYENNHH